MANVITSPILGASNEAFVVEFLNKLHRIAVRSATALTPHDAVAHRLDLVMAEASQDGQIERAVNESARAQAYDVKAYIGYCLASLDIGGIPLAYPAWASLDRPSPC